MAAETIASLPGVSQTGLGSLTGFLQGSINNMTNFGSSMLDKYFPPERREAWKAWLTKFATEKPYLASFLLSQIALSGLPLALFVLMTLTVVIFALLAGLLVGLLGALLFIVAAVGFGLIVLLPTLFFTTGAAVFIWLWGVGAYYIVKWFNEKDVPGIHTEVSGGLKQVSGLADLPGVQGDPVGDLQHAVANGVGGGDKDRGKSPPKLEKKGEGKSTGAQHHGHEHEATQRKEKGGADGAVKKATGTVDGVGKQVGGAVGGVTKGIAL